MEDKEKQKERRLVVVTGATGDLGRSYLEHYSKVTNTLCVGLIRRRESNPIPNVTSLLTDLQDKSLTEERIKSVHLDGLESIIFIHPVGKFKFEERGVPEVDSLRIGIDNEVLAHNLDTFHNVVRPLLEQRERYGNIPLTLVAFGSLSDPYNVPWWDSYSKSKLVLRKDMRELAGKSLLTKSVFINLSSVRTANEKKTRPFADQTYWISTSEVVKRSVGLIDNPNNPYTELDVFEPSPDYREGYYKDYDALKDKWLHEMGVKADLAK